MFFYKIAKFIENLRCFEKVSKNKKKRMRIFCFRLPYCRRLRNTRPPYNSLRAIDSGLPKGFLTISNKECVYANKAAERLYPDASHQQQIMHCPHIEAEQKPEKVHHRRHAMGSVFSSKNAFHQEKKKQY